MQMPDADAPDAEWLVYADALQVAGDPRGELISLVHGADAAARDAYVKKHASALLAHASHFLPAYRLTWRHCFIETAEVRISSKDAASTNVKSLLTSPAATQLRELAIVGVTDDGDPTDLERSIAAACKTKWPARMNSFAIVDERAARARTQISRDFDEDENLVSLGSLGAVWKLPQLEHLRFDVADTFHIDFGAVDGANLKSLTLRALRYADGFGDEPNPLSAKLGATRWPKLEELELRLAETFGTNIPYEPQPYVKVYSADDWDLERYEADAEGGGTGGTDWSELEPFFAKLVKSPLRRMALTSFDSATELLEVLRRTGLPRTLEILDLSDSKLDKDAVAWMRDNAKFFAQLTHLVLERTSIDKASLAKLKGLGPEIKHSHSKGAPTYRYAIGSE